MVHGSFLFLVRNEMRNKVFYWYIRRLQEIYYIILKKVNTYMSALDTRVKKIDEDSLNFYSTSNLKSYFRPRNNGLVVRFYNNESKNRHFQRLNKNHP